MNGKQIPLNTLPIGTKAQVMVISINGTARRRLLDLGVLNGTEIQPLFQSPSGNPVAYLIRGAVIALRTDMADKIFVAAL